MFSIAKFGFLSNFLPMKYNANLCTYRKQKLPTLNFNHLLSNFPSMRIKKAVLTNFIFSNNIRPYIFNANIPSCCHH